MQERIKFYGSDDYYHYICHNRLITNWDIPEKIQTISDMIECAEVIKYINMYPKELDKYKSECYKLINENKDKLNKTFKELSCELDMEYENTNIINLLIRYYDKYFTKEALTEIFKCTLLKWAELLNDEKFIKIAEDTLSCDEITKCVLENKILSQELVFQLATCKKPVFNLTIEQCNNVVKAEIDNGYSERTLKAIYSTSNKQISKLLRIEAKNKIIGALDSIKSNIIISNRYFTQHIEDNYKLTMNLQTGESHELVSYNFVNDIIDRNLMIGYETITELLTNNDILFVNGILSIAIESSDSNITRLFNDSIETDYIHKYTDYYTKKFIEDWKLLAFLNFLTTHNINVYKYINHLIDFEIGNGFFTIKGAEDYYEGNLNNINRHLCIQLDSLIKQYKLFSEYNTVSRELVSLSTESLNFEITCLRNKKKYASSIKNNKFAPLYNKNRSLMGLSGKTIYDIVEQKKLDKKYFRELLPFTKKIINKLISEDILCWYEEDIIYFSKPEQAFIMKYLNEMNSIFVTEDLIKSLNELHEMKCIEFSNYLFSDDELSYLNFILKNGNYSDELGLRNEYLHTGESKVSDEEANLELIRIILVTAYKILDDINNNVNNYEN